MLTNISVNKVDWQRFHWPMHKCQEHLADHDSCFIGLTVHQFLSLDGHVCIIEVKLYWERDKDPAESINNILDRVI